MDLGFTVRATDGDVGKIDDLYFDDEEWTVRYVVVNTGSWLAGRRVLLSPVALGTLDLENEVLAVNATQDEVENSPDINLDEPVYRQQLVDLHEYYGWPAAWAGGTLLGTASVGPYPVVLAGAEAIEEEAESEEGLTEKHRGDPHLRSTQEVIGYHIQAKDGEIGHVDDFFVDDAEWSVSYLQVDTRKWLPGRKVLLATLWIEDVDWAESKVSVELTREQIKDSPEHDPSEPVTQDYEVELYAHYEVPPPTK